MEKTFGVSASVNGTTCMAFPSPATPLENGRSCSPLSASGRSSTAAVSSASSPGVHVPLASTASSQPASSSLVISRNRYGQVTVTSQPTNESEFQLYRVLQHANLLSYYDTFISQGGDDVQQLCEAGEEEFLEIMALVGMASKPLHVRRLQKALQEWVHCPSRFQMPLLSLPGSGFLPAGRAVLPHPPVVPVPLVLQPTPPPATVIITPVKPSVATASCGSGSSGGSGSGQAASVVCTRLSTPPTQQPQQLQQPPLSPSPSGTSRDAAPSPSHSQDSRDTWQPQDLQRAADTTADPPYPSSSSPLQMTPVLMDSQIQRLAGSAQLLASTLPSYEPKPNTSKKKISKELEFVMSMPAEDPKRMDRLRRYAAIYGRFDCKRKAEKPLTLHEVSVNEAAAQICAHLPALLTRRDELFPLARQVVRHSGYQYSKGHSRSQGAQCYSPRDFRNMDDGAGGDAKRLRLDSVDSPDTYMPYRDEQWRRRQERLEQISDELRQLRSQAEELGLAAHKLEESRDPTGLSSLQIQIDAVQDQERQLLVEQNNLILLDRQFFKSCLEFDEEDSQMSPGSAPSPTGTGGCDSSRDEDTANESQDRPTYKLSKKLGACSPVEPGLRHARKSAVQQRCAPPSSGAAAGFPFPEQKVIASSAGNIIAVANPALSMSTVCEPMSLVNYKSESAYRIKSEPNAHNGAHNLTKD